MHVHEHKNVYLCIKLYVYLPKMKNMCAPCFFFLCFPTAFSGAVCVQAFLWCTALHGLGVIWFLLPYLAHCLLHFFVLISLLLSLPFPAS